MVNRPHPEAVEFARKRVGRDELRSTTARALKDRFPDLPASRRTASLDQALAEHRGRTHDRRERARLGVAIRNARIARNLSFEDVAAAAGVRPEHVKAAERGAEVEDVAAIVAAVRRATSRVAA